MGLFNWAKNMFTGAEISEELYNAAKADAETEAQAAATPPKEPEAKPAKQPTGKLYSFPTPPYPVRYPAPDDTGETPPLTNAPPKPTTGAKPNDAYVAFKFIKDFQTTAQVADRMQEKKIVIVNLEEADADTARRVMDFVGGAAYMTGSIVKRVAFRVFMITPKGVDADGEFVEQNAECGIRNLE
jgi:FtsZ-interacting cell division protein YlmF